MGGEKVADFFLLQEPAEGEGGGRGHGGEAGQEDGGGAADPSQGGRHPGGGRTAGGHSHQDGQPENCQITALCQQVGNICIFTQL